MMPFTMIVPALALARIIAMLAGTFTNIERNILLVHLRIILLRRLDLRGLLAARCCFLTGMRHLD